MLAALLLAVLPQDDVAARLAEARVALGRDLLEAEGGAVRAAGRAESLGAASRQVIEFDADGRYAQRTDGPLARASGFDGERHWSLDWNGVVRTQTLGDAAGGDMERLFLGGAWCSPGAPLSFEAGAEPDGLAFRHADGVLEGELRLDAATSRPSELTFGEPPGRAHWTFADWREQDGVWFPGSVRVQQSGEEQSFALESLERLDALPETAFEPPRDAPQRARFDPEVAPGLEVRRAPTGHLLVRARVDGEDLGWFIFDTGAGTNCISTHVAEGRLEGPFGRIAARGVGGTVPTGFWRAKTLQVGPLTLEGPILMGLDLSFLTQPFGVEVAGIVGYEFLMRCAAEIDTREGRIAIHDPASYALPEGGRWEPILLYGRAPCVPAAFEGHAGPFKVDTGAAGDTVTMHYEVVQRLALLEGRETRASRAGGVGGQVATREGRLERFELGGHVFEAVEAAFATEPVGAFADAYLLGNIGGRLLEPFVLVFDYPGERLGFVPR